MARLKSISRVVKIKQIIDAEPIAGWESRVVKSSTMFPTFDPNER